ncbi:hypothetical protein FACS1894162_4150 [Bacteroidia bacterium]|nr:hypothetical protein FACS1894162_4150 [Bacteroidia bacterium]
MEWSEMSNVAVIKAIGSRLKDYRLQKRLTQQNMAERAGVSVFTIAQIEKGHSVSLSMLIPVLRVLRLLDNLDLLLPETSVSPIELLKLKGKIPKRIKIPKK